MEDFWFYNRSIPAPSTVFYNSAARTKVRVGRENDERTIESFSLFKTGIEPSWEDDSNVKGGEWWMRKALPPGQLDTL